MNRLLYSLTLLLLGTLCGQAQQSSTPLMVKPGNPVGEARGIHPGRVAWTHAPGAAKWVKGEGRWFEPRWNDQTKTDWLVDNAVTTLTGQKTPAKAWTALFKDFNRRQGRGAKGYERGQKIAIKINLNNTSSYEDNDEINASPYTTLSLLRSLVNDARVPQKCITVFDASRCMTDAVFNLCHKEFPNVHYVDNQGNEGREQVTYYDNAIPYSVDNGPLARGLARCAVDADYLINVALLKGHVGQGVTLCAKNWYGVTDIHRNWRKNHHNNFNQDKSGKPRYMTFTDFMAHKHLGEKTMLFMIDATYGCSAVGGAPTGPWKMTPFNGTWPSSMLASQDGVAIDAVGMDFLLAEFPSMPDLPYCDMYLLEAAKAGNPPSGATYDPERDGTTAKSLGVLDHWDNPRDKRYGRNLGKKAGIELLYKKQ